MTYKEELNKALALALEGDIDGMYTQIKVAEQQWKSDDVPPFEKVKPGIEYVGLAAGLSTEVKKGYVPATRGERELLEAHIETCEGYAQKIGEDIALSVRSMTQTLEATKIPHYLEQIKAAAGQGNEKSLQEFVETATQYAGKVDITDLVEAAKKEGIALAEAEIEKASIAENTASAQDSVAAAGSESTGNPQIDTYFEEAMRYAREGSVRVAESRVRMARELAGQYNVDISAREEEVVNAGYEWQMKDAMRQARKFVKQKTWDKARAQLTAAKQFADRLGQDINGKVRSIEDKLPDQEE